METQNCSYSDCGKVLPGPYGVPGVSLSRIDNRTLICSECGKREAFGPLDTTLLRRAKIPVSDWLTELDSHTILLCEQVRKRFERETGEKAPWGKGCTREVMQSRINARGKGGTLAPDKRNRRVIGALDIAAACYDKFAGEEKAAPKFGMGSQFREYVAAIARNGK